MSSVVKALIGVLLLVVLLCGYYLYKAGGDVTLAKAVMSYEITEFFGGLGPKDSTSDQYAELADAPINQPIATTDETMFREGNRFSDYKKEGTDEQVEIRANP